MREIPARTEFFLLEIHHDSDVMLKYFFFRRVIFLGIKGMAHEQFHPA